MIDLLSLGIPDYVITLIETLIIGFLVILLILHLYLGFALYSLAKRTNTPRPWLGFIPIANVYLMARIADLSGWYTTSLALAIVPYIGAFITTATFVYIWYRIARKVGRPGWWSLMLLVPVINMVMIGMIAWGKHPAQIQTPEIQILTGNQPPQTPPQQNL